MVHCVRSEGYGGNSSKSPTRLSVLVGKALTLSRVRFLWLKSNNLSPTSHAPSLSFVARMLS